MGPTMVFSISQLAEIAVLASARSQVVIQSQTALSASHLQNLWSQSRKLSVSWYQQLNELALNAQLPNVLPEAENTPDNGRELSSLLHEIFVTEMLVRVWATALVGHGRVHLHTTAEHISRQVVSNHSSLSERALSLLNQDDPLPLLEVAQIGRLRRKTERWTDVLIGHSGRFAKTLDFAHDPAEAADVADLNLRRFARAIDEPVCLLLRASIRTAFEKLPYQVSTLAADLAQLILAELPESDELDPQTLTGAGAADARNSKRSRLNFAKRPHDLP